MDSHSSELQSLKQQWQQFQTLSTLEKSERSKDVQNLIESIDKKIEANAIFISAKNKIASDQCNIVGSKINQARNKMSKISSREKQNMENCKNRCLINCSSIKSSLQKGAEAFNNQIQNKTDQIKEQFLKQLQAEDQKYEMDKKQINESKKFIENELKKCQKAHNQSMNSLCLKMEESISEVYDFLNAKKGLKKQKELKLKYMIENVLLELEKLVDRQQKFGKMTYQSLLKLIEDFHVFIQGKNLRI